MAEHELHAPFRAQDAAHIHIGDIVFVSGTIYTARDAAHKRLIAMLDEGRELPIDIRDQTIYYAGPAPAKPGAVIGPVGPTTSMRMDKYAPRLIRLGLTGMIGKGERSAEVIEAMRETGAVYLAAVGGAAALIARCVESCEVVAFDDLGAEAIRRLEVRRLPTVRVG